MAKPYLCLHGEQHTSIFRTMQQPSSSHPQFVDISTRSSRSTSPFISVKLRTSSFVRAALHSKGLTFSHRQTLDHALASRTFPVQNRNLESEKRRSSSVSASITSYSESVGEGLLRLGGFCMCRKDLQIAIGAASTIIFAVANKVLYKMALVPLKEYPFFLALINTFGYVVVYFSMLYMRYQAGIVTGEMLGLPKLPFVLSGGLEALGLAAGMAAAANLPGTSISILLQTFLVWQLVLSMAFLKKRFSFGQIAACLMVLLGVGIALSGSANGSGMAASRADLLWALLMIISCAFQASSTVVKEFVFQNASKHLKGGSVDIFVVNSYGSAFQSIFVLLMLPFLSQLRGVPFSQLHSYMASGAGCLFNIGSVSAGMRIMKVYEVQAFASSMQVKRHVLRAYLSFLLLIGFSWLSECSGATLLTFSYVVVNLAFNISLLSLLKMSSAVVSSLCSTLAVPLAIYIFTLPLPYVGVTASVQPQFVIGVIVLLSGLALYNICGCFSKNLKHD